jgi:hypothetical protein
MLRPTTPQEVQEAVLTHPRLRPRGAGTKPALSSPKEGEALLDLSGLRGILEYEPEEFVFTALAGTPLREIEAALKAHGQYLPFDPPLLGERGHPGGHRGRRAFRAHAPPLWRGPGLHPGGAVRGRGREAGPGRGQGGEERRRLPLPPPHGGLLGGLRRHGGAFLQGLPQAPGHPDPTGHHEGPGGGPKGGGEAEASPPGPPGPRPPPPRHIGAPPGGLPGEP